MRVRKKGRQQEGQPGTAPVPGLFVVVLHPGNIEGHIRTGTDL